MNHAVGWNTGGEWLSSEWKLYRKLSDAGSPGPARLWILIEQHPDSVDDGRFAVDCRDQNERGQWVEFPGSFHDHGCSLAFADGHTEMHHWQESLTMPPLRYCGCLAHYATEGFFTKCPNSSDLAWLQERTSARR
jgi:prepilin-type processing-associated H-X9-DG protein